MTKDYSERIIVALDVADLASAQRLIDQLQGLIKIFKVGSQLFTAVGPEILKMVTQKGGRVFLDLKFQSRLLYAK